MGHNEEKYKNERRRLLAYIKEYASKNGISQENIAAKTGFTRNNVNRMLMGRYTPTLDNFIRLAESIGHSVELVKKFNKNKIGSSEVQPKFMFSVDTINQELYILHRQYPACLIHIFQEIPVRFIIEDLYDDVDNPADILTMPFVEEAKDFFKKYGGSILGGS